MDPIYEHSDAKECGLDNENVHVEDEKCFESVLTGMGFDSDQDFVNIDHVYLTKDIVMTFHFSDLEIAYEFYNWYGRMKGFSARKGKVRKNKNNVIVEKTFLCHREGFREKKDDDDDDELEDSNAVVREPRSETRTGCLGKMKVRLDVQTGRWHVRDFKDEHNHKMLIPIHTAMLPAHRKMSESDIMQMNGLRKVGISTPHIYGTFAMQSGGFENIGFSKRDVYNRIRTQRLKNPSDVKGALQYLRSLAANDRSMFWRHTVDKDGRLQRLIWCDGHSQLDYKLFGDVLAFDATYKKNKYHFPLVVFSGINHHNQTTIFASAFVADETEETYVWLLDQLMVAMKGKVPLSVITDGDLAMRNAIKRVFPNAHHRLCAWHLLRNATSNVKNTKFVAQFKKCMLADYDIPVFYRRWERTVIECGLQDNSWVREMYEKKRMWATCFIRGHFFAGVRTTSRCEGLHAQLGRFVNSRHVLVDFLKNYHHCLQYFRYKEIEADYASVVGEPVLQTQLIALEKSACRTFTKEVFKLFRPALSRGSVMRVKSSTCLMSQTIFTVSKYGRPNKEWQVSFLPEPLCIKCCCKRMESFGLPCDHIIGVLVHLNFDEIPACLVLDRWTMGVKENLYSLCDERNSVWDSVFMARCAALDALSRKVNRLAARSTQKFNAQRDLLTRQFEEMDAIDEENNQENEMCNDGHNATLRDPVRVGTKGRGVHVGTQSKRRKTCGLCGGLGHNRKTCSRKRTYDNAMMSQVDSNIQYDDFDDNNNATNNNDDGSNVN